MAGTAFSQMNMPSVSMPEISSPAMPSISMPSVSSSNNDNSNDTSKQNTTDSSSSSLGTGLTATALMGLSNTTGLETLSALLGASDETSTDSSSLSSLSSLSSISSLLSGDSTLSSLSSLQGTSSNANYLLLSQIIEKLNDISKKLDNNNNGSSQKIDETSQGTVQNSQSAVAVAANETKREIVRFRINSSNILSSITDVYISKPETDGSFLLTADRVYTADYKKRTETFYMFFTPEKDKMTATISVLQDYENTNSFLYRLSTLSPVETKKTGNLISIMINNPSFKVDFLLSLE